MVGIHAGKGVGVEGTEQAAAGAGRQQEIAFALCCMAQL